MCEKEIKMLREISVTKIMVMKKASFLFLTTSFIKFTLFLNVMLG